MIVKYLAVFVAMIAGTLGVAVAPALAQSVTRSCSAAPSGQGAGTICTATMSTGDGTNSRTFKYYYPQTLGTNKPVVFFLHGGTENADGAMAGTNYSWNLLADTKKFIVVYPEGKPQSDDASKKNWNDCRAAWTTAGDGGMNPSDSSFSNWNDVTYMNNLLNWFQTGSTLSPNMNRVYVAGPSNGGMMTLRLARESISSRFRSFGPALGALPVKDECPATPAAAPVASRNNIVAFTYGSEDQINPPAGGCVSAPFVSSNCDKGRLQSAAATVTFFKSWLGVPAASSGTTITITDASTTDGDFGNNNASCSENSQQLETKFSNSGAVVRLHVINVNGAGHTLPGSTQVTSLQKNTFKIGCRNLDRTATTYLAAFWGL